MWNSQEAYLSSYITIIYKNEGDQQTELIPGVGSREERGGGC